MRVGFMARGIMLPPINQAVFFADPPIHEVTIHVRFASLKMTHILKPGDQPIPLKEHIATFRRAQFGPDEIVYQLKSSPPKGWSWVVHNGSIKAYRTSLLYARKD